MLSPCRSCRGQGSACIEASRSATHSPNMEDGNADAASGAAPDARVSNAMTVEAVSESRTQFIQPCVDCGLWTGSWCVCATAASACPTPSGSLGNTRPFAADVMHFAGNVITAVGCCGVRRSRTASHRRGERRSGRVPGARVDVCCLSARCVYQRPRCTTGRCCSRQSGVLTLPLALPRPSARHTQTALDMP